MQEQQAEQVKQEQEMKLRIEEIKNQDSRQIITYKDSPLPIQFAMAAHAGLIPQEFANYMIQVMIQQLAPQFFQQQILSQQQPMQPQQPPPQMPQMNFPQTAEIPRDPQQIENQQKPQTMTNAAAQSLMLGGMPAI